MNHADSSPDTTMASPAEQLFFSGNRRMQADDHVGAELCFRQALAMQPDFGEAAANLGYLCSKAGDPAAAESYFLHAIATRPELEEAYLMLGVLWMEKKRFIEAEQLYRDYLQRHTHSAPVWSNLGVLLACLQRDEQAEECHRRALVCDPEFKKASFNLSYLLLRQERWDEGWRRLEDRWQYPALATHFTCPRWQGEALNGKSLIVGFEAGHGDMIFYMRYIAELKRRGVTRIALVCHPALVELFKTLDGVDELFAFDAVVPFSGWDYWVPPMSLPYLCQTRAPDFLAAIPYLQADRQKVADWQQRVSAQLPDGVLRVGIVWCGNPLFENDADRSIRTLALLKPLSQIEDVALISLQKGQGEAQAREADFALWPLGHELHSFADTAALIQTLDLVISVDTAVAHLAGAMGVPCWVLLPDYRADWRWHIGRSDSPWYPKNLRLFRQARTGGWPPLILQLATALQSWKSSGN